MKNEEQILESDRYGKEDVKNSYTADEANISSAESEIDDVATRNVRSSEIDGVATRNVGSSRADGLAEQNVSTSKINGLATGTVGNAKIDDVARRTGGASEREVTVENVGASEIEKLTTKIAKLEDQLIRAVAELQNFQKRTEREKADIANFSITKFAKDVLTIFDSLQLALGSCADTKNPIAEGIKLTLNQINKTLETYGISMIDSINKKFDPNYHQAINQIEADAEAGTIVKVMQEGFMIKDRLLRPALVSVAK